MRKLVSLQKILDLQPIDGADRIERATVMGWNCVVKKGEFQVGDPCVYFEIDSILPDDVPWSDFMLERKFRVKTIKLKGQISQGLALPTSILPPGSYEEEQDLTEILRVKKYEPQESTGGPGGKIGRTAGNFPLHLIPKTDEIRLQSAKRVLEEIKQVPFYISLKYDGTSFTCLNDETEGFMVCSRNQKKKEEPESCDLWKVANKYNLKEKLPIGYAIQGELCGPKWQKNRLGLKELDLFVFNVYNLKEKRYLDLQEFLDFCSNIGVKTVNIEKIVNEEDLKDFNFTIENFLNLAKGKYEGTNTHREGLVIRPVKETYSPYLKGRLSFKVINNDFLLKEEE